MTGSISKTGQALEALMKSWIDHDEPVARIAYGYDKLKKVCDAIWDIKEDPDGSYTVTFKGGSSVEDCAAALWYIVTMSRKDAKGKLNGILVAMTRIRGA